MSSVISVENLGKKFFLNHQGKPHGYVALRDVLSERGRQLGRTLLGRGKPAGIGGEREEFWALQDVSFKVQQGDRIGIIGRNGAGKSTLLKILSRITEPTTGSACIRGRMASLLEVGTGFHPELTGRENIFLNGAILGMNRAEIRSRFDEIVDFAEIERFLDTPVKRYSSGMYVRLAFAVAAHLEPEILIVDEVLAVGDAQFQKKCLGKMEQVGREGRTVLFVSHNMAAVQQLCSTCILLREGRLQLVGDAPQVISLYYSSSACETPARIWSDIGTAPGDDAIRLLAVSAVHGDKPVNVVPIDEEFSIEFDFLNLKAENDNLSYSVHILDRSGYLVFCSNSIAAANIVGKPAPYLYRALPVGKFRVRVKIPGNFLNDQLYRASVAICSNTTFVHVYEKEVLSFTVYETGAMREENHGHWGGAVRPRFETELFPLELRGQNE